VRFLSSKTAIIGIIVFSFILRMLWFYSPVVRDEGASGYIAMVWSTGVSPYSYPMAAVNPPAAYLLYLVPSQIFGNFIEPIRLLNNILCAVSVGLLYLIGKNWLGYKVALISAAFYGVFISAPAFETQLAIPSSFSLPFVVASIYFCSVWLKDNNKTWALFISGLLMSTSALILQSQVVGIFLLLVMIVVPFRTMFKQKKGTLRVRDIFLPIFFLIAGIVVPLLVTTVYFWNIGAFDNLIQSTIFHFGGSNYISQPDVALSLRFLIVGESLPLWLFSVAGIVLCLLHFKRSEFFVIAWAALFAIVAIPQPHFGRHFSQLVPPLSLLSGIALAALFQSTVFRSARKHLHDREKMALTVFLATTLVLSFSASFYFQAVQYPNTNFSFLGESWNYTFSNNWTQQQELVSYLKTNATNQTVFIHGWEAEIYWLSGKLAPDLRWASSYKVGNLDISDAEYQKILEQVKSEAFDYIVLMKNFPADNVMGNVTSKYFFIRDIGPYSVYSKYDPEGNRIEYSFVNNLNTIHQIYRLDNGTQGSVESLNNSMYLAVSEKLTVNGETRTVIKQIPINRWDAHAVDSRIAYDNISIPPNTKLNFGIAFNEASWSKETDGATFEIMIQEEGNLNATTVFTQFLDPHSNVDDRGWKDYSLDLEAFVGKTVSIYFITNGGPQNNISYDWIYWSNPILIQHRPPM
jgi:hypothetical protein